MKAIILAACLLLSGFVTVAAGESSPPAAKSPEARLLEGDTMYLGMNYVGAAAVFRELADEGYAPAQSHLAYAYRHGEGVEKSDAEALKWYRKAADQKFVKGQYNLGVMYENGAGTKQDFAEAMKWYRLAADQGYPEAMFNIGNMYSVGSGVPVDYIEAMKWFRMAADKGLSTAEVYIGNAYAEGRGVSKDMAESVRWYRRAAERGDTTAIFSVGYAYETGLGVPQNFVEAVKWYQVAAKEGDNGSLANLGYAYAMGNGVKRDLAAAERHYLMAMDYTQPDADDYDAMMDEGDFAISTIVYAAKANDMAPLGVLHWYRLANERGNAEARYRLGTVYEAGQIVAKDMDRAVILYQLAAQQCYKPAIDKVRELKLDICIVCR